VAETSFFQLRRFHEPAKSKANMLAGEQKKTHRRVG
jgi:hypothetical protein